MSVRRPRKAIPDGEHLRDLRRVLADDSDGVGVAQHPLALLRRVRRVDRHDDASGHRDREVRVRPLGARRGQNRDSIAGRNAEGDEAKGERRDRCRRPRRSSHRASPSRLDDGPPTRSRFLATASGSNVARVSVGVIVLDISVLHGVSDWCHGASRRLAPSTSARPLEFVCVLARTARVPAVWCVLARESVPVAAPMCPAGCVGMLRLVNSAAMEGTHVGHDRS